MSVVDEFMARYQGQRFRYAKQVFNALTAHEMDYVLGPCEPYMTCAHYAKIYLRRAHALKVGVVKDGMPMPTEYSDYLVLAHALSKTPRDDCWTWTFLVSNGPSLNIFANGKTHQVASCILSANRMSENRWSLEELQPKGY